MTRSSRILGASLGSLLVIGLVIWLTAGMTIRREGQAADRAADREVDQPVVRVPQSDSCVPTIQAWGADPAGPWQTPFPDLGWTACAGAQGYDLQQSNDIGFTNPMTSSLHSQRWVPRDPLASGSTYVRVRAIIDGVPGAWSAALRLMVAPRVAAEVDEGDDLRTKLHKAVMQSRNVADIVVLQLPGGRVELDCDGEKACLNLQNADGLIIEGNGTEFIVHTPDAGMFNAVNSTDLVIRNLSVDYDPLPYTEGVVLDKPSSGVTRIRLNPGMPAFDAPHIAAARQGWAQLLDPNKPGRLSDHAGEIIADVTHTEKVPGTERDWLITSENLGNWSKPGDIFHKQGRYNGSTTVSCGRSKRLALDRITVFASPGGVCNAPNSEGLVVVNSQTVVKEGRFASVDADILHIRNASRGPWVENNYFWGGMDDKINIRSQAIGVQSEEGTRISLKTPLSRQAGGEIVAYAKNGEQTWRAKVNSVADDGTTLVLDRAVGEHADFVYDLDRAGPFTVIQHNDFVGGNRLGLLLRVRDSAIASNRFIGISDSAIAFENHPFRADEGLTSLRVRVIDNLVTDNRDGLGAIETTILVCRSFLPLDHCRQRADVDSTPGQGHESMWFVGNEIRHWGAGLLNQKFAHGQDRPANASGIYIGNAVDVHVLCNTISPPDRGDGKEIQVVNSTGVDTRYNPPNEEPACKSQLRQVTGARGSDKALVGWAASLAGK